MEGNKMIEVKLARTKSTKNTFVYGELDSSGSPQASEFCRIPTLYIRKAAFEGALPPQRIVVRVENEV